MELEFLAPYPLEECKRRLETEMNAPFSILALAEARPLIGRFYGNRLRARTRTWYRNSFQTYLSAEFTAENGKTRIRCRFSMHPLIRTIMTLWFSMLALALVGGFIVIGTLRRDIAQAFAIVVPLMLPPAGGAALMSFGRYLSRFDQRFLTDFIQQTLDAKRI